MSQSIGIPGFISERKKDIGQLTLCCESKKDASKKRARITMYRTRSFKRYFVPRSVKQKRKHAPLFSSITKKRKRVFRRKRRIPFVLQSSFMRNRNNTTSVTDGILCTDNAQSSVARLNSHIWHAKRFFMLSDHGWMVPQKHRSRGLKAVDGLLEHCAVQDASFCTAYPFQASEKHSTSISNQHEEKTTDIIALLSIEIVGDVDEVETLLAQFTDPHCPLFSANEDGERSSTVGKEVDTLLYERGRFPAGCIGPVSLLPTWRDSSHDVIQVWVSCHPAIAQLVYTQLLSAAEAEEGECAVRLAPARLNRFRLRGAAAAQSLLSLLSTPASATSCCSPAQKEEKVLRYLQALLALKSQGKHVQDGEAIAVSIADPRRTLVSESSATPSNGPPAPPNAISKRPTNLCGSSALFNKDARISFRRDHELNEEKHHKKVRDWEALFAITAPFTETPKAETESTSADSSRREEAATVIIPADTCPMLVIRKEAPVRKFGTRNHQLQGWDVLVPAVWGTTVFRALQVAGGATAVGSAEMDHMHAKTGLCSFPRDYVDTPAGREYWQAEHEKVQRANAKRPPLKQMLHRSMKDLLLTASNHTTTTLPNGESPAGTIDDVLIVRGEGYLRDFLPPPFEDLDPADIRDAQREVAQHAGEAGYEWRSPHIVLLPQLPPRMFLQVLLVPSARGLVHDLAEIVMPTAEDIALFVQHKKNFRLLRKSKQTALHDAESRRAHTAAAAKHSGLYGHGKKDDSQRDDTNPTASVAYLSKDWEGVKLTEQMRVTLQQRERDTTRETSSSEGHMEEEEMMTKEGQSEVPTDAQQEKGSYDFEIGCELGRRVIGTVTSGQQSHLNNSHFAVGLCNVNALNEVFRRSYGRHTHPQAHMVVLFRNARSDWLRPAVLQII